MEERQPADAAVALFALECLDHLHHVGGQVQVGDLHAGRDSGGSGGVLQIGNALVVGLHRFPRRTHFIRNRIHRDDPGPFVGRPGPEELAYTLRGLGGGQDRRRCAVVQNRVQAADVTGLGRVEQRYGDPAGVERSEECDEVLEVLRAQNRHSVTGLGYLLQTSRDSPVASAEVGPAKVVCDAIAFGGEIQESVGEFVAADLCPPLDVSDQAGAFRKHDPAVLDERVMERHTTLLSERAPASGRPLGSGQAVRGIGGEPPGWYREWGVHRCADMVSAVPNGPALIRPYFLLNVSPTVVPPPNPRALRRAGLAVRRPGCVLNQATGPTQRPRG